MKKKYSIFGWKAVRKNYGWKNFFTDSIMPLLISSILSLLMYIVNTDVFLQLKHIVSIGISIIPAMVALILTAYTIMLTFIASDKFSSIKNTDKGKKLILDLNSSFAACLFVSTISIIIMILVSSIANLGIQIERPEIVNYPTYFIVCYFLIYSVSILTGIVIDIFNSGQTVLINNENQNNDKSNNSPRITQNNDNH